jgi:hypothetical protein
MRHGNVKTRRVRTIRCIASQSRPATMGSLHQAHLDLDFANGEVALLGEDLAFQRLKDERFIAMGVGNLDSTV